MALPLRLALLGLALAAGAGPREGAAQGVACDPPGATLRGWEERARITILDREGSFFGRFSERGILQRFNPLMDAEYHLDLVSSGFPADEECAWHRAEQGARFWAGSIDHLRLIQGGQIKVGVPLGSSWGVGLEHWHEETLRARRDLLRLGFHRLLAGGAARAFLTGTLTAHKPESDLEAGVSWFPGRGEVTLAVGALDLFSDLVYQVLGVSPALADSTLDYRSHPFTARVFLDLPLHPRLRTEAFALFLTPTRVWVEAQGDPLSGFVQDEEYAYAGGLVEWTPWERTALGGLAAWKRARTERNPLVEGPWGRSEAFDLLEESWEAGAYLMHDLTSRFRFRGRLSREGQKEVRQRWLAATSYRDRSWVGRADLLYRAPGGFLAEVGVDGTSRSGEGPPPVTFVEPLLRTNYRLRGDLGWRFGRRALLVLGANLDLDSGGFDGGHGRFALYW